MTLSRYNKKYSWNIDYKTNNANIYNKMSKKQIEQGLNGLLATTTPQEQEPETKPKKERVKYETICWNLHPNDIENVRRIAKYEGKRSNAVVTDALRFYFDHWKPIPQEKPTLLFDD